MLPTRESNFLCMWVLTEIQQQQKILQVTWEKKVKLFYLIVIKDEWIWIDLQISVTSPPFSLTAPDFFFFFFLKFHLQFYQVKIIISELMNLRAEISCQLNMDEKNNFIIFLLTNNNWKPVCIFSFEVSKTSLRHLFSLTVQNLL